MKQRLMTLKKNLKKKTITRTSSEFKSMFLKDAVKETVKNYPTLVKTVYIEDQKMGAACIGRNVV